MINQIVKLQAELSENKTLFVILTQQAISRKVEETLCDPPALTANHAIRRPIQYHPLTQSSFKRMC